MYKRTIPLTKWLGRSQTTSGEYILDAQKDWIPKPLRLRYKTWLVLAGGLCTLLLTFACQQKETATGFSLVGANHSGITFENTITTNDTFNILKFHYIYNGGGVGVRDFNADGLPDLLFTGNQVPSKLYLNKGNLQFEDVTAGTGINTTGRWTTGVSINDVNADGWPDVYVSVGGLECGSGQCKNQLYLHRGLSEDGIPQFEEVAAEWGLEDDLYTQQALFLDIDRDCDLDVYLLHNVIDNRDKNAPSPQQFIDEKSKDRLLRNDGEAGFTDVSEDYGIEHRGYGLGVVAADFNQDGWPDIYVAQDFLSSDQLYLNVEGASFTEAGQSVLKHQSYNSMGVDVADLNGDELVEIMVLDMLPEQHERLKRTQGFMNYDKYEYSLKAGYAPQFVRNTLQRHNGFLREEMLPFSDIGYQSGVYQTDWSWSPLFADYDNDGDQDLFVTNGYGKDITDLDFIKYSQEVNAFGTATSVQERLLEALDNMPENKLRNYYFEQESALNFSNKSTAWLPDEVSISNGAAYADLDMDGDLDVVVNNIDEAAYLLENQSATANYLQLRLTASCSNAAALGAQVTLWTEGQQQYRYFSPVRGYLSCMNDALHFGLGNAPVVDSLLIHWPDGTSTSLKEIASNQLLTIKQEESILLEPRSLVKPQKTIFQSGVLALNYTHEENAYQDYDVQALLLSQLSAQGPVLAATAPDTEGSILLCIGTSVGASSLIYRSNQDGTFALQQELTSSKALEVTDVLFFDADADGDDDLYLLAGGSEVGIGIDLQDQLYFNDGTGNFQRMEGKLPEMQSSGSCVRAVDFDGDGDQDLFVGARLVPGQYPQSPSSYLLRNENGTFVDITDEVLPELRSIGMVTDATWTDLNDDELPDLLLVGDWMPITVFYNGPANWQKSHDPLLAEAKGLWNCIVTADFDGDGDQDFILGNRGHNSSLQASPTEPLQIIQTDLDNNGSVDPFVAKYYTNKEGQRASYPYHSRDDVLRQCPMLQKPFTAYEDFANASFNDIIAATGLESVELLAVHTTSSIFLEQTGD
ncbi:MAG: VCBS repeat-containing protein, partial [Bacteroidota bacterium]